GGPGDRGIRPRGGVPRPPGPDPHGGAERAGAGAAGVLLAGLRRGTERGEVTAGAERIPPVRPRPPGSASSRRSSPSRPRACRRTARSPGRGRRRGPAR
ncbi:LOW QUALITY PROTEIN: predicted protein, partial [Streptomyces viridochromogenes DSM 40736]